MSSGAPPFRPSRITYELLNPCRPIPQVRAASKIPSFHVVQGPSQALTVSLLGSIFTVYRRIQVSFSTFLYPSSAFFFFEHRSPSPLPSPSHWSRRHLHFSIFSPSPLLALLVESCLSLAYKNPSPDLTEGRQSKPIFLSQDSHSCFRALVLAGPPDKPGHRAIVRLAKSRIPPLSLS